MSILQGAIFDFDGTLGNSMYIWDTFGEDYLRQRGVCPRPDLHERIQRMSLLEAVEYYRSDYGLTESPEELLESILQLTIRRYGAEVDLKGGVRELLEDFRKRHIKMALATANDRRMVEAALRRNHAQDYFETVLTCVELGVGKDRPDIYLAAANAMGVTPEHAMVFEDAAHAAQTAKNAGFLVAGVYDPSEPLQRELRQASTIFFPTFEDAAARLEPFLST